MFGRGRRPELNVLVLRDADVIAHGIRQALAGRAVEHLYGRMAA
ncbi:hypothetical protein ACIQ1J_14455 [Streptomyces sp. NPDC097107]